MMSEPTKAEKGAASMFWNLACPQTPYPAKSQQSQNCVDCATHVSIPPGSPVPSSSSPLPAARRLQSYAYAPTSPSSSTPFSSNRSASPTWQLVHARSPTSSHHATDSSYSRSCSTSSGYALRCDPSCPRSSPSVTSSPSTTCPRSRARPSRPDLCG